MSRKKIAVIIAGVIAVVLLAGGLWAVVAHNNRAKALEEATAAYTKAGAVLEKVVSGVDAAGCIENGGSKDICAALEKTIADARVGLVEKPGKDADKMKEGAKTLEKLTESLQALGITLATQQAKAAQDYLDKECPLHLDPECDSLRKGDLKLPEIKLKTEAIKARVAGAAPAQAPAADGSSHGTGGGNADYSGESDSGSSYSEPAYEAPEVPAPVEEAALPEPPAPAPASEPDNGGWVKTVERGDTCGIGDEFGNFEFVPCP